MRSLPLKLGRLAGRGVARLAALICDLGEKAALVVAGVTAAMTLLLILDAVIFGDERRDQETG